MRLIRPGGSEWLYRFCNAFGFMTDKLYPLEVSLFERLFEVLPDHSRDVFRRQLSALSIFQRVMGWRTLAMFPMRHFWARRGVDRFPMELRVATEAVDVRLASFKFRIPGSAIENSAVFHLVNGHFFTIDFGQDYHPIRFAEDLEIIKYKVNRSAFPSLETASEQDRGDQGR